MIKEVDFTYNIEWVRATQNIQVKLKMIKTNRNAEKLTLAFINQGETHIRSEFNKTLSNKEFQINFPAFQIKSEEGGNRLGSFSESLASATKYSGFIMGGFLLLSSLFSSQFSFLAKMIQIIEIISMFELFNVQYDTHLTIFLRGMSEAVSLDLIPFFTSTDNLHSSKAVQFKGKLTTLEVKPRFLDLVGYLGVSYLVIKIVNLD